MDEKTIDLDTYKQLFFVLVIMIIVLLAMMETELKSL